MLMLSFLSVFAQEGTQSLFRQSGKIYVVVAVLSIIMAGIILFLIRLDMKIKKLEDSKK